VKKSGRQFALIIMLMVASMTIVFAQAKPRDLQTELTKFWPDITFRNQNVWQLYPIEISELLVYPDGDFVINATLGGYAETFYINSQSNGRVEFDSDIYKLTFDKTAPAVKGLIFSLTSKYHPKDTYIGIIFDDRIVKSNIGKKNKDEQGKDKQECDEAGMPVHKVSQADFEKINNQGMESRGGYDTGIPIVKYGNNSENDATVSPNMVVKVFSIGHPIGDFMEGHKGQTLDKVRISSLDKTQPNGLKIIKEFPNDYLYPIAIGFVFNDKKKEFYSLYKMFSSDIYSLVSLDFFEGWQP